MKNGMTIVAVLVCAPLAAGQPCPPPYQGSFNYGPTFADAEAEQIALEMRGEMGPLLVNPDQYERIRADLHRIRGRVGQLHNQFHAPVWVENKLLVGYTGEALSPEVLCANEYYGVVHVQLLTAIRVAIIEFPRNVNFAALASEYRALPGVTMASPNGVVGGCPNEWRPQPAAAGVWRWTIHDREPDPKCTFCCTQEVWVIDTTETGVVTIIQGPAPPTCYANCDNSTTPPVLNIDDFTCFINRFAAAQSLPPAQQVVDYANCDGSTTPPVLNIDDFTCFINRFAAGCQ